MDNIVARLGILVSKFSEGKHTVFAKKAGIPPSTFQSYLKGRMPHSDHLIRINEYYGVDITWLLTGKGEMHGQRLGEGSHAEERIRESDPEDDVELIMQLTETVSDWIKEELVIPQAKKVMVKKLFSLMKVRGKMVGDGSREVFSNIEVRGNDGDLNIGNNNKIERK